MNRDFDERYIELDRHNELVARLKKELVGVKNMYLEKNKECNRLKKELAALKGGVSDE